MGMKVIVKELNILVIVFFQLFCIVESCDDKCLQFLDLWEFGLIEQDVDVVMFVFCEEYYKEWECSGEYDFEKMFMW